MALSALIAVSLLGFAPTSALADRTISLSSGTIELSLPPGATGSGTITVGNDGTELIRALVYVADASTGPKGVPTYERLPDGAPPTPGSAASWLDLHLPPGVKMKGTTPYIELKVGEQLTIPFTEKVPSFATPGDHNAVVFFEMFNTSPRVPKGSMSQVTGRIGCRIVTHVRGTVIDRLEVQRFAMEGFVIGDKAAYSFTIANTGNVDKRYSATFELLDGAGRRVSGSTVASESVVYAGNRASYAGFATFRGAGLGAYRVVLHVSHALVNRDPTAPVRQRTSEQARTIIMVPFWVVVALAAVVAVALLWIGWIGFKRVRRRSPHSKKTDVPVSVVATAPGHDDSVDKDDRFIPPPPVAE